MGFVGINKRPVGKGPRREGGACASCKTGSLVNEYVLVSSSK